MPLPNKQGCTIKDIYKLPDGQRAELNDGIIYNISPPSRLHQKISGQLYKTIANYIDAHSGTCEVYPASFAAFLNQDDKTYVESDISVICDKRKLSDRGCDGAPDWIIEIVSPSSQRMDYLTKLLKYRTAGVREYWSVNPITQTVQVYSFEGERNSGQYAFKETIKSSIYDDFEICLDGLLE